MAVGNGIDKLGKGDRGRIIGYRSEDIPIKIYEMGLLPGVVITKQQQLPFSGPVCLRIDGNPNAIALRHAEATLILIDQLGPDSQ